MSGQSARSGFCRIHHRLDLLGLQSSLLPCRALFRRQQRALHPPRLGAFFEQHDVLHRLLSGRAHAGHAAQHLWAQRGHVAAQPGRGRHVDSGGHRRCDGGGGLASLWSGYVVHAALHDARRPDQGHDFLVGADLRFRRMRDRFDHGRRNQECPPRHSPRAVDRRSDGDVLLHRGHDQRAGGAAGVGSRELAGTDAGDIEDRGAHRLRRRSFRSPRCSSRSATLARQARIWLRARVCRLWPESTAFCRRRSARCIPDGKRPGSAC